jgi:hypothetical protein
VQRKDTSVTRSTKYPRKDTSVTKISKKSSRKDTGVT